MPDPARRAGDIPVPADGAAVGDGLYDAVSSAGLHGEPVGAVFPEHSGRGTRTEGFPASGRGADGASRVAVDRFLLDGYHRAQTAYMVHVGALQIA